MTIVVRQKSSPSSSSSFSSPRSKPKKKKTKAAQRSSKSNSSSDGQTTTTTTTTTTRTGSRSRSSIPRINEIMPVSPRPKRSSVVPLLSSASSSSMSMPSMSKPMPMSSSTTKQPISTLLQPMSISTAGSAHGSSASGSNNNPTSSYSSSSSSPRIKKFQICMWITLILAFVHLISKPTIDVPPEDHKIKKDKDKHEHKHNSSSSTGSNTSSTSNKHNKTTTSTDTTETTSNKVIKSPTPMPTPTPTSRPKSPTDKQPTPAPAPEPEPEKPSEKATKNTKSSSSSSTTTSSKTEKTTKTTKKDKKHTPSPTPPPETTPTKDVHDDSDNDKDGNKDSTLDRDKSKDDDIITTPQPTTNDPSASASVSPPPTPPPKPLDPSSFSVLPAKTIKDVSDTSRQFVQKHCDMKGFNPPDAAATTTNWYPSQEENNWQQRAPYFIVAGVWNSGINDLSRTLLKYHPQIIPSKIPGFFLPKQFQHYYKVVPVVDGGSGDLTTTSTSSSSSSTEVSNVKVFAARNKMYASVYSRSALRDNNGSSSNNNNNTQVAMDVSPGLIFYAHTTAHSILCVAPWSKIVVLLRNPIDRVYKQWLYSKTNLGLTLSLEDWMAQEMQLMHDVGLIDAVSSGIKDDVGQQRMIGDTDNDVETTVVVPEREAWNKYQAVRGMPKSIGRSLYVLQLEEWIDTFKEAGMKPSDEMIILLSEEVEAHPQEQYTKLFQFLGLGPVGITSPVRTPAPATADPIKPETRKMLETFFRPYNRRLEKLLTENGFEGDWGKLWK